MCVKDGVCYLSSLPWLEILYLDRAHLHMETEEQQNLEIWAGSTSIIRYISAVSIWKIVAVYGVYEEQKGQVVTV